MDLGAPVNASMPDLPPLGDGERFSQHLRETMRARGIGFSELAGMLASAGAPISPATLSYWVSGRSRPRRRSSLGVVQALEDSLGLEDGELVDLVDIDAETWRYRSAAEAARLMPRGDEIEAARQAWGLRWDDGLRRECVRMVLELDAPDGEEVLRYELVLSAQRTGADRLLAVLEVPLEILDEGLRVEIGGRPGRRCALSGGASLVEVLLPRPLAEGEAAVVEWSCPLPGARARGSFSTWYMRPADLAITEVHLPADQGLWRVRRTLSTVGRAGRRLDEVQEEERIRGPFLQGVVAEVAAASCLLEWERAGAGQAVPPTP
jgi:hypothetical protein